MTDNVLGLGSIALITGLLVACLVALILVWVARREAEAARRQAREDVADIRDEARNQLADAVRRAARLDEREEQLTTRERESLEATAELKFRIDELASARSAFARESAEHREEMATELASLAGMTASDARRELVGRLTEQAESEAAAHVRRAEAKARRTAEAKSKRILTTAMQRLAAPTSAQSSVAIVRLPSEDMKGRIIGKEGRNIRTFEAVTGVNVVIDDTPDSVVLSSHDVERREIAQVALEALVEDGRIHPQRIEAAYEEAVAGADARAESAGHEAAEAAGVDGLHPELIRTLGRLRLRSSYGQNVLAHLVESAQVAALVAGEIGADVATARRAAFLHDVGKALTGEVEGTHAAVGAELAARLGEDHVIVNAIAAHHDEVAPETVEAVLVQVADACSAARPGARREDAEAYGERIEKVEKLVAELPGVRRVLAMAAGREIRVVVEPGVVGDTELGGLATRIARTIEAERAYPGEVTVTVIREIRASATAG
ncbi:MAG: ribonuclease Y [Myxococcales bacterium]|nr:ribonuclease Y [Myxococcales bacterium]